MRETRSMRWLKTRTSQIGHRVSGFPVAIAQWRRPRGKSPADVLRHLYARRYWSIRGAGDALELATAVLFLPLIVVGVAAWQSMISAPSHARRYGRPMLLQFADQIRLYAASGVMPASYYVFSLYEQPTVAHARGFLKRSETKGLLYKLVRKRMPPSSSFSDKGEFAEHCRAHGLPVAATIGIARDGALPGLPQIPDQDIFIKPLDGKGGRGAERWIFIGGGRFKSGERELSAGEVREHILGLSRQAPVILQPRLANHQSLAGLNCGALTTVRVLTCLNRAGQPEVIGAALRMAVQAGSVVDNFHVGGIAAAIEIDTGELGPATDLGKDARIGWLERHPVGGAVIAGRKLDWWFSLRDLALAAHHAFNDRLFVGWDIAMTPEGPVIVEANGSPDLDILQRTTRRGMAESRFAELLAECLRGPV